MRQENADWRTRLAAAQSELAHFRLSHGHGGVDASELEAEDEDAATPTSSRRHSIEDEDVNPSPSKIARITGHIQTSNQRNVEDNASDSPDAFEPVPPAPLNIPTGATLRDWKVPGCGAMSYDEDTDEVVLLACCFCGANCGGNGKYLGGVAGLLAHIRRQHGRKFIPGTSIRVKKSKKRLEELVKPHCIPERMSRLEGAQRLRDKVKKVRPPQAEDEAYEPSDSSDEENAQEDGDGDGHGLIVRGAREDVERMEREGAGVGGHQTTSLASSRRATSEPPIGSGDEVAVVRGVGHVAADDDEEGESVRDAEDGVGFRHADERDRRQYIGEKQYREYADNEGPALYAANQEDDPSVRPSPTPTPPRRTAIDAQQAPALPTVPQRGTGRIQMPYTESVVKIFGLTETFQHLDKSRNVISWQNEWYLAACPVRGCGINANKNGEYFREMDNFINHIKFEHSSEWQSVYFEDNGICVRDVLKHKLRYAEVCEVQTGARTYPPKF